MNGYKFYYNVIDGFADFGAGKADTIKGLETPDDSTLVVTLTQPAGDLPYLFALAATAPIPPNRDAPLGTAKGHDEGYGRFLVATGPYMFEGAENLDFSQPADKQPPVSGYEPAKQISSSATGHDVDRRSASRLHRRVQDLARRRAQGARPQGAGRELDASSTASRPRPCVPTRRSRPQGSLYINPSDADRYITLNMAVAPFDDIHVRKAVNFAIDKAGMRTSVVANPWARSRATSW